MASFLDNNIFVYADDVKEPRKEARAIELIGVMLLEATDVDRVTKFMVANKFRHGKRWP